MDSPWSSDFSNKLVPRALFQTPPPPSVQKSSEKGFRPSPPLPSFPQMNPYGPSPGGSDTANLASSKEPVTVVSTMSFRGTTVSWRKGGVIIPTATRIIQHSSQETAESKKGPISEDEDSSMTDRTEL